MVKEIQVIKNGKTYAITSFTEKAIKVINVVSLENKHILEEKKKRRKRKVIAKRQKVSQKKKEKQRLFEQCKEKCRKQYCRPNYQIRLGETCADRCRDDCMEEVLKIPAPRHLI